MELTELIGSSAVSAITVGSAVYVLMYKLMVKPLKDNVEAFKLAAEKDITSIKDDLKSNSEEDRKLRENFIKLEAKHDQAIDKVDDIKKELNINFGKLFQFMEERLKSEAALAQEVAVIKQKIG